MKFFVPILTSGGYVGLSIATLLSQHHKVMAVDIVPEKVELINSKKSPIQDEYIEKYLTEKELNLTATLDAKEAYSDADFVVIAAPTNYDSKKNFFDTSAVEAVIKLVIEYNPEAIMVIKSTIPVGFTASVREKYHCDNIIFSPEFLRESKALYDNLYPSRIIVGTDVELIKNYYCIIKQVNPDAVLAYTVKPDVYGGIVCAITKTPFIPNITGLGKGLDEKGIVQRLTIELYKRAVKKAKCVFFQNDSDRTFFDSNHIVYPKGITLPGSGVNLKKFVPLPYPGKEEPIRFIYVARVMKAKGIEHCFTSRLHDVEYIESSKAKKNQSDQN